MKKRLLSLGLCLLLCLSLFRGLALAEEAEEAPAADATEIEGRQEATALPEETNLVLEESELSLPTYDAPADLLSDTPDYSGTGTESNPYLIYNEAAFKSLLTSSATSYIKLGCDIMVKDSRDDRIIADGTHDFDFAGHSLTVYRKSFDPYYIQISKGGSLTFSDSIGGGGLTLDITTDAAESGIFIMNDGELTFNGGSYVSVLHTVESREYYCRNFIVYGNRGLLTVNDGYFRGGSGCLHALSLLTLNIHGGVFTSDYDFTEGHTTITIENGAGGTATNLIVKPSANRPDSNHYLVYGDLQINEPYSHGFVGRKTAYDYHYDHYKTGPYIISSEDLVVTDDEDYIPTEDTMYWGPQGKEGFVVHWNEDTWGMWDAKKLELVLTNSKGKEIEAVEIPFQGKTMTAGSYDFTNDILANGEENYHAAIRMTYTSDGETKTFKKFYEANNNPHYDPTRYFGLAEASPASGTGNEAAGTGLKASYRTRELPAWLQGRDIRASCDGLIVTNLTNGEVHKDTFQEGRQAADILLPQKGTYEVRYTVNWDWYVKWGTLELKQPLASETVVFYVSRDSEPVFVVQPPESKEFYAGGDLTLQAIAGGSAGITYQWQEYNEAYHKWCDLDGKTFSVLELKKLGAGYDGRQLRLAASAGGFTVYSQVCTLQRVSGRRGDVNLDARVNLIDVSLLFRMVTGQEAVTEKNLCDFNKDQAVTLQDVAALYHFLQTETLPGEVYFLTERTVGEEYLACQVNGDIADLPAEEIHYRWEISLDGGKTWKLYSTDSGSAVYVPAADVGKLLRVLVTVDGYSGRLVSESRSVEAELPGLEGTVWYSTYSPRVYTTLEAALMGGPAGVAESQIHYQWQVDWNDGFEDIPGERDAVFYVGPDYYTSSIRCAITVDGYKGTLYGDSLIALQ